MNKSRFFAFVGFCGGHCDCDNFFSFLQPEDDTSKSSETNPITRLMEYQKKKNGKEPVYVLVDEKGRGRKKLFTIEVNIATIFMCTFVMVEKLERTKAFDFENVNLLKSFVFHFVGEN